MEKDQRNVEANTPMEVHFAKRKTDNSMKKKQMT